MKCSCIITSFVFLFAISSNAQYNQWAWMAGDPGAGVYGVQGTPNAANQPGGARYEGGGEWVDLQGNFWHFSGDGYRNDLWKFNPVTNEWTWVKGSSLINQAPVFGTMGTANAANTPGGRAMGSFTWVDLQGNLWLFGGLQKLSAGSGRTNDLWKYDPITNMWTWMHGTVIAGDAAGVYGTKGVPNAANSPGGRYECSVSWVDAAGNLWLFGGMGHGASGTLGFLNDLWKYDILTNEWTWMSGDNTTGQVGIYGTMGLASATNKPGAREVYASWKDTAGFFWMYGGVVGGPACFDDLWKYDPNPLSPTFNQWTWMKGTNGTGNVYGTYGTQCVEAVANNPPAGYENRARWTDDCGNFWLFGGFNLTNANTVVCYYNDLWRFNVSTNNWTWVSGSNLPNQSGVYGSKGVPAAANVPGARDGALPFRRNNVNELWVFAGQNSPGGDLWKYIPDKPTAVFASSPGGCAPVNINFTNSSTPGCNEIKSHAWNFGDPGSGANNISSLINPSHLFNASGTYTVQLIVTNCTGSKDSTTQIIVVGSGGINLTLSSQTNPACNGFNTGSATISANSGTIPYTYNWSPVGGTTSAATGLGAGTYTVIVTDATGCSSTQTVAITEPPAITSSQSVSICIGSTYTLPGGSVISAGGIYKDTLASANGCDSIITTSLTVVPAITISQPVSICTGTTYTLPGGAVVSIGGIYKDTLTSANGCDSIITTTLTINPVSASGQSPSICFGYTYTLPGGTVVSTSGVYKDTLTSANGCDSIITTTLTVNSASASSQAGNICAGVTYTLPGGTVVSTSGVYKDTLTAANGCDSIITTTLTVNPSPTITISPNVTITQGATTTLTAGGGGNYQWSSGELTQNIIVSPVQTTTYCVTVTDNNGCTALDCIIVTIENPCPTNMDLSIPNAFSPNEDGENDEFCLQGGIDYCIKDLHINIYNRWGEKIYESDDKGFCWDGTYKNKQMSAAVFVYSLDAILISEKKISKRGNISLIR